MKKSIHFRPTTKAEDIINNYMKKHNLDKSTAINQIIAFQSEPSPQTIHEKWRKIGCPALLDIPEKGGYHCANKAPRIVPIPNLVICEFCWERQQKLKSTPTTTKSSPFYKPQKVLCKTGFWEDPRKIQGRCERCKLHDLTTWTECQQKQRLP